MGLDNLSNAAALAALERLIAGGGSSKQVAKIVKEIYEQAVGEYRPLIEALPEITELVGKDLAPFFTAVLRTHISVSQDKKLQAELVKYRKRRAEARFRVLESYETAGFTREEGMSLILADIAAMKTAMSSTKVPSALKKLPSKPEASPSKVLLSK